jgi:hypothetical protein
MLSLQVPSNHAHIDDLIDRLSQCLMFAPFNPSDDSAQHEIIRKLALVVQHLDAGKISVEDAEWAFSRHCIPNFSFRRWLAEMVEEGVYQEELLQLHA